MAPRLAVIALLIALTACGRDRGDDGDPVLSIDTLANGAVLVRNRAVDAWADGEGWRIVEELRIGSVDAEGPALFGSVAGLVIDDHGRMHILDRYAKEIRVFGPDGSHVRTYGREGAGPGELRDPVGLALDADGRAWVVDSGNARYAIYDTAGNFVASRSRPLGGYVVPWRGGFDEEGRLFEAAAIFSEAGSRGAIVRFDDDLAPRDTFLLPEAPTESYELRTEEGARMTAAVPFSPELVYTLDPEGLLWVGSSGEYRIARRTLRGDTVRVVEREHEPLPVTGEDRSEALERLDWFRSQGGRIDPGRIPDVHPVYRRLVVDPHGRLWVEPVTRDETAFDVFDPEGRYLGRVPSPARFYPWPIFREDRIYGLDIDSLGVTYAVRGRLVRP